MATVIGKLTPQPELWALLDARAEILQARRQEVSWEESSRQHQAYTDFISEQKMHVTVDSAQPLECAIADV